MKCLLLVLALVAVAWASGPPKKAGYEKKEYHREVKYETKDPHGNGYDDDNSYGYGHSVTYHGKYGGKCGNDGFYYNDDYSFTICSNGNAYQQRCAPGSRNSGYNNYNNGNSYSYRDFCDVNLVDYGYGVSHGNNGGYTRGDGYNAHNGYNTHGYNNVHNNRGYDNYGYDNNGYNPHGNQGYGYERHSYTRSSYNDGRKPNSGYALH